MLSSLERVSSGHILLAVASNDYVFELAPVGDSEVADGAFALVVTHALETECECMCVGHMMDSDRVYLSHAGTRNLSFHLHLFTIRQFP